MIKLSIISTVLNSHEWVKRQLLYMRDNVLDDECEFILMDDGSAPSIQAWLSQFMIPFKWDIKIVQTYDTRPWTQPCARNRAVEFAKADRLLFFDIDHILTSEIIARAKVTNSKKMHWYRVSASLTPGGALDRDVSDHWNSGNYHVNSFMIRKEDFIAVGGYDDRFCGNYGGDDLDFNRRCRKNHIYESLEAAGFAFKNCADYPELFHTLKRNFGHNQKLI